jgi:hypothetical protein
MRTGAMESPEQGRSAMELWNEQIFVATAAISIQTATMSARTLDRLLYEGETYGIISRCPYEGLFDPEQFGITTEMLHTGAYRGFECSYSVADETLLLSMLEICAKDNVYPLINETRPSFSSVNPEDQSYFYERHKTRDARGKIAWCYMDVALYEEIEMPMPYTGRLRIGHDMDYKYDTGMPPGSSDWMFRKVLDLKFIEGHMASVNDLSDKMAKIREKQPTAEEYWASIHKRRQESKNEAVEQFRMAAEQGDADAQSSLGALYKSGWEGGTIDLLQAYKWFQLAADQGDKKAKKKAAELAARMSPSELEAAQRLYQEFKDTHPK